MIYNNDEEIKNDFNIKNGWFIMGTIFITGFIFGKGSSKNNVNKSYCQGVVDGMTKVIQSVTIERK